MGFGKGRVLPSKLSLEGIAFFFLLSPRPHFYVLLQSLYLLPLLLAGAVSLLTTAFTCWCSHFTYYRFYVLVQSLYLLPLLLAGAVTLLTIAFTCWCDHFNFAGDPEKDVLQT